MEKIVSGCDNCPMYEGNYPFNCQHPSNHDKRPKTRMEWHRTDPNDEWPATGTLHPITPDWCPLITEPLTIKYGKD